MCDGTNPDVKQNEKRGLQLLREAINNGYLGALEYKTYYDIRFDKKPNLEKITANLNTIVKQAPNATRALNTLAEFNHAQASSQKQSPNLEH